MAAKCPMRLRLPPTSGRGRRLTFCCACGRLLLAALLCRWLRLCCRFGLGFRRFRFGLRRRSRFGLAFGLAFFSSPVSASSSGGRSEAPSPTSPRPASSPAFDSLRVRRRFSRKRARSPRVLERRRSRDQRRGDDVGDQRILASAFSASGLRGFACLLLLLFLCHCSAPADSTRSRPSYQFSSRVCNKPLFQIGRHEVDKRDRTLTPGIDRSKPSTPLPTPRGCAPDVSTVAPAGARAISTASCQLARLQSPRARGGVQPEPPAARAGPLPVDLGQQPRRILHGPGGRA